LRAQVQLEALQERVARERVRLAWLRAIAFVRRRGPERVDGSTQVIRYLSLSFIFPHPLSFLIRYFFPPDFFIYSRRGRGGGVSNGL